MKISFSSVIWTLVAIVAVVILLVVGSKQREVKIEPVPYSNAVISSPTVYPCELGEKCS